MPRLNEVRTAMYLRKIFKFIIYVIICSLLVANGYMLTARLVLKNDLPKVLGFAQLIILSGSMQPAINVGDMIIIREQNSYRVNDIVTYRWKQSIVTHRIVELNDSQVVLKGDANNATDGSIPVSAIEGKVVMRIPKAGDIVLYSRTPLGLSIILSMIVLLILLNIFKILKGKVI